MARINWEDSIYKDDSFIALIISLGCKTLAIGVTVEAFTIAQKYYLSNENDRLIPLDAWDRFKWKNEVVNSGGAIIHEKGVYVRGSKDQFAWLIQKSEAGQSTSPAKLNQLAAARQAKAEKNSERTLNGTERNETGLNGSEALTPPLTLTLSHSPTHSQTLKNTKTKKVKSPSDESAEAELGKQAHQVIAKYCERWKAKYKTNAYVSKAWAGNAKTLIKDHGLNRSLELVEAFLEMNETWFIQRRHSFDQILTSLAQITHFAGTGVQITKTQLTQLDKTQANQSAAEGAAAYFRSKEKV